MINNRILVPLDGSAEAERALAYAEPLARALGGGLTLLRVSDRAGARLLPTMSSLPRQRREARERRAYLRRVEAELVRRGVPTNHQIVAGAPAAVITRASRRAGAGMVVMATRARAALGRLVLGSVADAVSRTATVPVLLVCPLVAAAPWEEQPVPALRRLIVPLDGSAFAEAAIPLARELARVLPAEIILVRVVPLPIDTRSTPPYASAVEDAKRYLRAVGSGLDGARIGETMVIEGDVANLVPYFHHAAADLMVMTTRGQRGVRRLVLGSVAQTIVQAGVPVVLVPPTRGPGAARALRHAALVSWWRNA